ncbi:hypothetical protein LTR53_008834 [Teratosphaeriaceae sp. CCFEE 6253]|nr:hypothetical protein LTR53_008834 [Teratosphaeriaceae sp. CCFEE 6253]
MPDKKIVVVIGATGQQGGSVVEALLLRDEYAVKGVTRNLEPEASRALEARGVTMIQGDLDSVDSLKGAYAVFGVTDFAASMRTHGPDAAQDAEFQQAKNIAQAAAATGSLQHYIWSTIPSAWGVSSGKMSVPHFESKARADEYILRELKDLASKTTFLWVGYYPSNVRAPAMAPMFHATSGKDVWLSPVSAEAELVSIGSQQHNVGVFVRAILDHPQLTLPARYVMAEAERTTLGEVIELYAKLTGRPTQYVRIDAAAFNDLFPGWAAITQMLQLWEIHGVRSFAKHGVIPLTAEDLAIDKRDLVMTEAAMRSFL